MHASLIAEHASLLKVAALYLVLVAIHVVAPDRDADLEGNDWLAEGDTGYGAPTGAGR